MQCNKNRTAINQELFVFFFVSVVGREKMFQIKLFSLETSKLCYLVDYFKILTGLGEASADYGPRGQAWQSLVYFHRLCSFLFLI